METKVIATTEELFEEMKGAMERLNSVIKEDVSSKIAKASEECNAAIAEYNGRLRHEQFDAWLSLEKPIVEALTVGDIDQYHLHNTAKKSEKAHYELQKDGKIFDLIEFDEYASEKGKEITKNPRWLDGMQSLASWFNIWWTKEIGIEDTDLSKALIATVTNNKLSEVLEEAWGYITDECKTQKKDVAYIKALCLKNNAKGDIVLSRKETMCKLVVFALNRRFNGKAYTAEKRK